MGLDVKQIGQTAVNTLTGGVVGGALGLLGNLFKKNNNGFKNQQKLMQQALS